MELTKESEKTMWGKPRSKFGEWFDKQEQYNQSEFADLAGINKDTMTKACNDESWYPSAIILKKIITAARLIDPNVRSIDFWDV